MVEVSAVYFRANLNLKRHKIIRIDCEDATDGFSPMLCHVIKEEAISVADTQGRPNTDISTEEDIQLLG